MSNRFKCFAEAEPGNPYSSSVVAGTGLRQVECSPIFYAEAFLTKTYFGLAVQVFESAIMIVFWYCSAHVKNDFTRVFASCLAALLSVCNLVKIMQVGISAVQDKDDGIVLTLRSVVAVINNTFHFSLPLLLTFYTIELMYAAIFRKCLPKLVSFLHVVIIVIVLVPIALLEIFYRNPAEGTYLTLLHIMFPVFAGLTVIRVLVALASLFVAFFARAGRTNSNPIVSKSKSRIIRTFIFNIACSLPGLPFIYKLYDSFMFYLDDYNRMRKYETGQLDLDVVVANFLTGITCVLAMLLLLPALSKTFFCGCGKEDEDK